MSEHIINCMNIITSVYEFIELVQGFCSGVGGLVLLCRVFPEQDTSSPAIHTLVSRSRWREVRPLID